MSTQVPLSRQAPVLTCRCIGTLRQKRACKARWTPLELKVRADTPNRVCLETVATLDCGNREGLAMSVSTCLE